MHLNSRSHVVSLLVLILSGAGTLVSGQSERSESPDPGATQPSVRIRVLPTRIYRGGFGYLEATISPQRRADYQWRAAAGNLLGDDRRKASWQAPDRYGEVTVEVAARIAGQGDDGPRTLRASVQIKLHAPSTAGMVRIPGGICTIGDTWTDVGRGGYIKTIQNMSDKPAHRVELSRYFIDRDRVTNVQYVEFLEKAHAEGLIEIDTVGVHGRHPSSTGTGALVPYLRFSYDDMKHVESQPTLEGAIRWEDSRFVVDDRKARHPVVDVTWAGADAYAIYFGKRLPTSAEWELAARGVDGRRFPWGNDLPTPLHANVNNHYGGRLFPVGSFSPLGDSPYGVRDMMGGVFEWVHDWFNSHYYEDVASTQPRKDPRGPHWGREHTFRGVDWTIGFTGSLNEQPPLTFRYQWFFDFPEVGDSVATNNTGFRTAVDDYARREAKEAGERRESDPR